MTDPGKHADERRHISSAQKVSWGIDLVLAIALITAILQVGNMGGQFIERLDAVVTRLENLSGRVSQLEARPVGPGGDARLRVLETRVSIQQTATAELKQDMNTRMDKVDSAILRVDNKLDQLIQRRASP